MSSPTSLERFDSPDEIADRLRLRAVETAPGCALAKLLGELGIAHRIGGASLAEVRGALHHGAVVQLHFDDRRHLVETGRFGFGIDAEVHPLQQRLHVGSIDHVVGELLEAGLALDEQDRHAEFHAELRLQLVRGPMMDEGIRHVVIGADRDPLDPLRAQIVTADEIQHDAHARMRERPAGMRLDRNPGKGEGPRIAELAVDHVGAVATARGPEEPPVGFEAGQRSRKSERRQLRRHHAAFGGASGMEGLGHGAEVLAQSGGLCGAQAQSAARGFAIESEQPGGACRGADRTAGRGAVEALLIVARHDRLGHLAFDLDADLIRGHQITAAPTIPLGERQRGRQRRRRRMGEQAVDAILGNGELRVVVVIGVDRNAVGECREARGKPQFASDHGAAALGCDAQRGKIAPGDATGLRRGAGQRQADAIEHRTLAEMGHVGRYVLPVRGDNEAGDVVGQ